MRRTSRCCKWLDGRNRRYFKKLATYIDWVSHLGSLVYLIFLWDDHTTLQNHILGIFVLILVYYRGFGLLRIFGPFTTLVGMINTIINKLVVFFVILFYAYFMVVVLMMKLEHVDKFDIHIRDVYYWMILGGIESDAFDIQLSYLPVVFGSLIITIVLLNILIAFLSNVFSRLEDQQKVNALREKAFLILDFELVVRLFKYVLPGTIKLDRKLDHLKSEQIFSVKKFDFSEVNREAR